ncbi:MAG: hypothetical protein IKZ87_03390, partial [Actinomycetaceae bacterium]|nr:hypothetical protein [Actinomycetaceae bacterium]
MSPLIKELLFENSRKKFTLLRAGNIILWVFLVTSLIALLYFVPPIYRAWKEGTGFSAPPAFWVVLLAEIALFWVGIIIVYVTSVQLGIKKRALGNLLGMVPVANLVMLFVILRTTGKEARHELARCTLNEKRAAEKICQTKYPILMVHGVFFRDSKHFNYWGRIPRELEKNGATIYYGEHHSAASVDDCAKELEERILQIIRENGYEKINVIAHSKGGLDMRTAISTTSIAPYIASLTTINTPHHGCEYADY